MNYLKTYMPQIDTLCKKYQVKSLYVFGSILKDNFNDKSDIDLIVDFDSIAVEDYVDNYFDLKFSLQNILKRPVDLLEEKALKNPYFKKAILNERQLIYG